MARQPTPYIEVLINQLQWARILSKLSSMNSILPQMIDDNQHQPSQSIQTLLHKPLNRREFLIYLGTLVLLITGVAGLMKALQEQVSHEESGAHTLGFGYGPYGGNRK